MDATSFVHARIWVETLPEPSGGVPRMTALRRLFLRLPPLFKTWALRAHQISQRRSNSRFRFYYKRETLEVVFDHRTHFRYPADWNTYDYRRDGSIDGYLSLYLPCPGDVVFDLGSYHGAFTILAAALVGDGGRVYSCEPQADARKIQEASIRLNQFSHVHVLPFFIGCDNGTMRTLVLDGAGSRAIDTAHPPLADGMHCVPVFCKTLDALAAENGIETVDFLKADVEGSELDMLAGAARLLRAHRIRNLAIASYHWVNGQRTHMEIERTLRSHGYLTKTGYPTHLTTYGWLA